MYSAVLLVDISPLEPRVYRHDPVRQVFMSYLLKPGAANQPFKLPLLWKVSDAFHQILVARSVV